LSCLFRTGWLSRSSRIFTADMREITRAFSETLQFFEYCKLKQYYIIFNLPYPFTKRMSIVPNIRFKCEDPRAGISLRIFESNACIDDSTELQFKNEKQLTNWSMFDCGSKSISKMWRETRGL
jgi:hypothetical protein